MNNKIIVTNGTITVIQEDGTIINKQNCTEEQINAVIEAENSEKILEILMPTLSGKIEAYNNINSLLESAKTSKILVVRGDSVYMPNISELSLPTELVLDILRAEKERDVYAITSYVNFWVLMSLNPDSRCRQNLFWFLKKYGLTISTSGLFIAYRNALVKKEGSNISAEVAKFISERYTHIKFVTKKSPKNYVLVHNTSSGDYYITKVGDSGGGLLQDTNHKVVGNLSDLYQTLKDVDTSTVYTDAHSKTTEIRLGHPVSIPRSQCDGNQDHECSRGLHVAGKTWLQQNYFGDTALRVLVNPAEVVAVPYNSQYGKLRTCCYYPISIVEFEKDGKIIDEGLTTGFEDDFMEYIVYGKKDYEDTTPYKLEIPTVPELDPSKIKVNLENLKHFTKILS